MNCPKDQTKLKTEKFHGVEVDRCPTCHGMWLDYPELGALEDTVMTDDHAKGTMIWSETQSNLNCPKCGAVMQTFDYRLEGLMLDVCPKQHGFWLDAGEEKQILKDMEKREQGLEHKQYEEEKWARTLRDLETPGLLASIKNLFR